jgi:DNA repair protein RecN (Recombination protein N)
MISRLYIKNFALIDELETHFSKGLNVITGETGAGKSIVIGAIELLLGARADYSKVGDQENKCIVEGSFLVPKSLEATFQELDLDYDEQTIIRRELLPGARGRAFINDSPVTLESLRAITGKLVDLHRQHEILMLENEHFQFEILDSYAGIEKELIDFRNGLRQFRVLQQALSATEQQIADIQKEKDFNSFLQQELEDAALLADEEHGLQEEFELQSHSEAIAEALAQVQLGLDGENLSTLSQLHEISVSMSKIKTFSAQFEELHDRFSSCELELRDILREVERMQEKVHHDPERLAVISARLDRLHQLEAKHRVQGSVELINILDGLRRKNSDSEALEWKCTELKKSISSTRESLALESKSISTKRKEAAKSFEQAISSKGVDVGLKEMLLRLEITESGDFHNYGKDVIDILFSANPGRTPESISKVASGGELSRLMLLIKELLASNSTVQTMIFDEIDMGISGEVAVKVGTILKNIGSHTQVISITHLPQVAAQGDQHFKVRKFQKDGNTYSSIYPLSPDERVKEISLMLSGKSDSEASIRSAKELLGKA